MGDKGKKIALNGLLFALILALTIVAVFHGEDLHAVRQAIRSCDSRWLLPGLGCVAAFIGGEAVILRLLLRSEGQRLGLGKCWLVASVGFFFSAVTPSAGGGQPMQVYFLRKERVPVAVGAVTLMAVTLTYKMVLVVTGLSLAAFRLDFLRDHFGNMFILFWVGLALTCGFVALLMLLIFHPRLARKLADRTLTALERLRILRENPARRERLWAAMDRYHETAAYFKSHMGLMALVQAVTFVQRFALFTVHQALNSTSSTSVKNSHPSIRSNRARVKPKPVPVQAQVTPSPIREAFRWALSCRYHMADPAETQLAPGFLEAR